ncbi:uncharacterized protein METZ01_LOCUS363386, partial [marine metagenome]
RLSDASSPNRSWLMLVNKTVTMSWSSYVVSHRTQAGMAASCRPSTVYRSPWIAEESISTFPKRPYPSFVRDFCENWTCDCMVAKQASCRVSNTTIKCRKRCNCSKIPHGIRNCCSLASTT